VSESDLIVAEDKPLSPLQIFFAKVAIVTVAVLVILYGAVYFIGSFVESQQEQFQEQLQILRGGPAFWGTIESKLYKLADEPDLPPEKKKKIVDALRKLSSKYRPYFEALAGDTPGEPKK
jgi:hypothetical protein